MWQQEQNFDDHNKIAKRSLEGDNGSSMSNSCFGRFMNLRQDGIEPSSFFVRGKVFAMYFVETGKTKKCDKTSQPDFGGTSTRPDTYDICSSPKDRSVVLDYIVRSLLDPVMGYQPCSYTWDYPKNSTVVRFNIFAEFNIQEALSFNPFRRLQTPYIGYSHNGDGELPNDFISERPTSVCDVLDQLVLEKCCYKLSTLKLSHLPSTTSSALQILRADNNFCGSDLDSVVSITEITSSSCSCYDEHLYPGCSEHSTCEKKTLCRNMCYTEIEDLQGRLKIALEVDSRSKIIVIISAICLVTSFRPLKLSELAVAVNFALTHLVLSHESAAVDADDETIKRLLSTLTHIRQDGTVEFLHRSIYDFLLEGRHPEIQCSQEYMAHICLDEIETDPILVLCPFEYHVNPSMQSGNRPLRNYACTHWALHCQQSENPKNTIAARLDKILQAALLESSKTFDSRSYEEAVMVVHRDSGQKLSIKGLDEKDLAIDLTDHYQYNQNLWALVCAHNMVRVWQHFQVPANNIILWICDFYGFTTLSHFYRRLRAEMPDSPQDFLCHKLSFHEAIEVVPIAGTNLWALSIDNQGIRQTHLLNEHGLHGMGLSRLDSDVEQHISTWPDIRYPIRLRVESESPSDANSSWRNILDENQSYVVRPQSISRQPCELSNLISRRQSCESYEHLSESADDSAYWSDSSSYP